VVLKVTNLTTHNSSIQAISLVSDFNTSFSVPVSNWNYNNTTKLISFSVTPPPGSYNFLVSSGDGYYLINSILNVSFPSGIVNTTQTTSYAGGSYTLSGGYLSPTSYITVNGFRGYPISTSNTSITYAVPPLVTGASQAKYSLASVSLLDLTQFTYSSDQPTSNVSLAFDGVYTTIYGSANVPCWI
jgi:hypothetical protein